MYKGPKYQISLDQEPCIWAISNPEISLKNAYKMHVGLLHRHSIWFVFKMYLVLINKSKNIKIQFYVFCCSSLWIVSNLFDCFQQLLGSGQPSSVFLFSISSTTIFIVEIIELFWVISPFSWMCLGYLCWRWLDGNFFCILGLHFWRWVCLFCLVLHFHKICFCTCPF